MEEKTKVKSQGCERPRGLIARILAAIGICRRKGLGMVLTRRFLVIPVGVIVCVVLFSGGFVVYSSTPQFCDSCHIMAPYVASWKESSHKDVACVKCHISPGWRSVVRAKFIASKQLVDTLADVPVHSLTAEIDDAACLRGGCHETRLIESRVLFKGKYKFDHAKHLKTLRRGKQLRCTSCHSQMVQGSHMTVTESVCFTCHFKGRIHERIVDPIAGCTSCHDAPTEAIKVAEDQTFKHQTYLDRGVACWKCHFDSVQGTGDVPKQACQVCHSEPEKLDKIKDSKFVHDWHVTKRKVECFQCHSEIRHGLHLKPAEPADACATCHSGGHDLQANMFAGRGGKGVPDMPSQMYLANVDCVACHEVPFLGGKQHLDNMTTFEATAQACVECHGGAYKRMLPQWREIITEALAEAKAELAKAEAAYRAQPGGHPQKAKAGALLEVARYNCEFVEKGHGVHNLEYATELLDKASTNAREVIRLLPKPSVKPAERNSPGAEDRNQ
ncbi:MAG: hypothetical protein GWP05_05125 [Anaerolineaceae bacterium]|nr:hypothetical protein [Anaerolineaceae bacterium]